MREKLEQTLNRPLTPQESRAIDWLCRWDVATVEAFEALFGQIYQAGQQGDESK